MGHRVMPLGNPEKQVPIWGSQRYPFPQCGGGIRTCSFTTSHPLGPWPSCDFLDFSLVDSDRDLRTILGIPFFWTEHMVSQVDRWGTAGHGP